MIKFDGLLLETKKTVTKDKKALTKIKLETISYSDVSKFKAELPEIADMVLRDENQILKKADFEAPSFDSMLLSVDSQEARIENFCSSKVSYKTNKDRDIILTFDISFYSENNPPIDSLIGNVIEIML